MGASWQYLDGCGVASSSLSATALLTLWREGTLDHTVRCGQRLAARPLLSTTSERSQHHTPQALVWTDSLPEWLPMADAQPLLQQQEEEEAADAGAGAEPPAEEASLNFTNSAWFALDPHAHIAEQQPPSLLPAPIVDPFGPPPAWGDAAPSESSTFWQSNPFGAVLDEQEVAMTEVAMAGTNPFAPGAPSGDEASNEAAAAGGGTSPLAAEGAAGKAGEAGEAGAAPVMVNPFGAVWGGEGAELAHSPGPREEGGDGGEAGGDVGAAGSTTAVSAEAAAEAAEAAEAREAVLREAAAAVSVQLAGAGAAAAEHGGQRVAEGGVTAADDAAAAAAAGAAGAAAGGRRGGAFEQVLGWGVKVREKSLL